MTVVSMRKMLENGVHFGHQTRKWNPKMKPYIYTAKNGIYILDLAKTEEKLEEAYKALKAISEKGGKILFVGTKKQAQATILEEATRCGSFYVNQRWLGGTLTNFRTIQKSIKRLLEIEEMESSGTINVYTKKEQSVLLKKKDRLDNFLGGIKDMKKLPDALFIVDPMQEHNAVLEARKLHIPVFALIDTNADPNFVDYPIPSNDDAIRSIKLMTGIVADAIVESKGGVLEFAYQEDPAAEDISMKDVMINVEQQAAEYERKKRARFEERRAQMAKGEFAGRRPYNGSGNNAERRTFRRDSAPKVTTDAAAKVEDKAEEIKKTVATDAAEVKADVKAKAEKVEAKVKKTEKVVKEEVGKAEEAVKTEAKKVKKTAEKVKADAEEVVEKVKKTATKVKEEITEGKEDK